MRRLIGAKGLGAMARRCVVAAMLVATFAIALHAASAPVRADSAAVDAQALMATGVDYIDRGLYDQAAMQFSTALDSGGLTDEGRAIAHHHRGVAFQKIGQQSAAIEDYTAAISSGVLPEKVLPKAYYNRGIALANTGKLREAERDYLEAVRLNPAYAAAYHNLANLERRRGDYEGAINHYTAAIDNMTGRDRKLPLFGRALSLEQEGKLDLAANDLTLALELDPEFELAEIKLDAISPQLAAADKSEPETVASPRVVPATLSPFQTAASGQERGQVIRVASIGGWRTTATRFTSEETQRDVGAEEGKVPSDELVTGSLRPAETSPGKRPLPLAEIAPASATGEKARYRVQLGAFRDEALARQAWNELPTDAKPVLGPTAPAIQRADLGVKGVFYRLQAGAFAEIADARSVCKQLERRQIACFVVEG